MNISKRLLALLAIFCIIASAGIVCAAEDGGSAEVTYADDDAGYAGSQYNETENDGGYAGSQYNETENDGGYAGSQYNETAENAFAANQTNQNATNGTVAGNATNSTNATNPISSLQSMLATGNPILILFIVCAVLGGYLVLRRRG